MFYNRSLWVICFTYDSLYMSIPILYVELKSHKSHDKAKNRKYMLCVLETQVTNVPGVAVIWPLSYTVGALSGKPPSKESGKGSGDI